MFKKVEVKILNPMMGTEIELPKYETKGSAGFDLRACIAEALTLAPGAQALIPTGLAIKVADPGYAGFIKSRSGICYKNKVRVSQGDGTIDSDYELEVGVLLHNFSDNAFVIEKGMRIAQFVVQPVIQVELDYVDSFTSQPTDRAGGFGHTGLM